MKKALVAVALAFMTAFSAVPAFAETAGEDAVTAFGRRRPDIKDCGPEPWEGALSTIAAKNPNYRAAIWTGKDLQLTVMSIPKGGEVGLEVHPDTDQMLYVVKGTGTAQMGAEKDKLDYNKPVGEGSAVFVPMGTWHNIVNTGHGDLKLFTVYAPPHHPHGTVQKTKAEADAAENAE